MAEFRRWILVLAVLAACVGVANAQQLNCILGVGSTPPLRQEGFTELTGDIIVTCTGGAAVTTVPFATVTVTLNATVTSRLLTNVTTPGASEALLLVDEPGLNNPGIPGSSLPGFPVAAPGTTFGYTILNNGPSGSSYVTNAGTALPVIQGTVSGTIVTFSNVPIVPPAVPGIPLIFRIVNVRVNATALAANTGVTATVSIAPTSTPPLSLSITGNNTVTVGTTTTTLGTSVVRFSSGVPIPTTGFGIQQCLPYGFLPPANTANTLITLQYSEKNSVSAFKPGIAPGTNQGVPGTPYSSLQESGFIFGGFSSGGLFAGQASFGTRVKAVFSNIPTGVTIYVAQNNTASATSLANPSATQPFAALTAFEGSAFAPLTGTQQAVGATGAANVTFVALTPTAGTAVAVWEVGSASSTSLDTLNFPIAIVSTTSAAPGTITVNMSYAPNPTQGAISATTAGAASSSLPIPRFTDTSTAVNAFLVQICRTVLLFPFVSNAVGFETGLGISNTSADKFGTTAQAGTCTLDFFGTGAPGTSPTTPSIASGTTYANTVTGLGVTGFQGYVIATCNFQYGHGYASLFNGFGTSAGVFSSYLALTIPDPATTGGVRLAPEINLAH